MLADSYHYSYKSEIIYRLTTHFCKNKGLEKTVAQLS